MTPAVRGAATVPGAPMLSAEDVTRSYRQGAREVQAVRGISLRVAPGEMVVLLGPSGSGKSTLLHLLGGLDRPTTGRVVFDGRDLASLPDDDLTRLRRDRIGHVFQFFNLIPTLTAAENVALPLLLGGARDRDAAETARAALDEVGLSGRAEHFPEEMSGGEQQRAAIARALAVRPSLLLADEPTGNLDSETGRGVLETLRGLTRDGTRAVVMVTHDEHAARIGDRRVRLRDGRIEREE